MHERLQDALRVLSPMNLRRSNCSFRPASLHDMWRRQFVLVVNWWVDSDSSVTPAEVDAWFRVPLCRL